ncbi:MAG: polyketide synthase of type I, partial [Gemmatimonadetes bacterium]
MKRVSTHGSAYATAAELEAARLSADFERLATAIVASQLRALFADERGGCSPGAAFALLRPSHRRWLEATLRLLGERRLLATDPATQHLLFAATEPADALWKRWDAAKRASGTNDDHRAYLVLIEACLRRLPEILTDAVPATDVMFPESSMHLVEGIYKHNRIADHFNAVLAESLRAELAAKAARGGHGLRLLEIGAGTGGTTAALLPMLRGYSDLVEEYCYTDLSRAFLLHAEEAYKPQFPALRTAIFDVGKALAAQSIEGGRYDAVIAANVLHATPSIRETLRNAKAALKRGGILLVNEISEWSWHTHFTFGLLEGWWLYEDERLRLAGSAGLSPSRWERLLKAERFYDICFPAGGDHGLGQQIIVARSDGMVRQRMIAPSAAAAPSATTTATATATKPMQTSFTVVPPTASRTSVTTARTHAASTLASDDRALREACAALFRETIAGALRMEEREIDTHKPLEHYGLDSILVVQLTTRFRKLFPGVRSTLFFEHQSIDRLVQHFVANDRATLLSVLAARGGEHGATSIAAKPGSSPDSAAPVTSERVARRRFATRQDATPALQVQASIPAPTPSLDHVTSVDVAVIGVSGRYPQAPDLERFWENLSSGRDCTSEIPAERWRWQDHYDPEKGKAGKSYTKWGGFLEDIDKFDPLFFRIAPKEAKRMDPQERLFLETSYHAIEDSGYTPGTLAAAGKVGVFVGVMNSRYTVQPLYYSIANRVSFLFNFAGPSFAVDSACSSSLTAVHLALDSLRGGTCDVAIAGGVSLIVDPHHMLELTAVGMLSEGAHCRSFGRNADGFVDAEGVGAVVLKPLTHAIRDGDNIQAVIRGSAVNAGGRTHGYTVPNPAAQAQVVSAALERAQVDSAEVSYIEAHGTGTALGDPIEVAGLARAFRSSRRAAADAGPAQHCAIGSVKSNIGHCESAAGIAALTKVLLQLRHGQLVPTLHADAVNDEIDFSATPFRLQRELVPWRRMTLGEGCGSREIPRIAGISSFGAGGANAHLVV